MKGQSAIQLAAPAFHERKRNFVGHPFLGRGTWCRRLGGTKR